MLAQTGEVIDPRKLRHDLRTPMNAIKGYGEMLIEDAANAGRETFLDDLSRLLAAVEGVLARIEALVDFTGQPADPDGRCTADRSGRCQRHAARDPRRGPRAGALG